MLLRTEDQKLRIFLSADIVGSTQYKTKTAGNSPTDWSRFFTDFFKDFQTSLVGALDSVQETYRPSSEIPRLWKVLGDELIFVATVINEHDIFISTAAFYHAISKYDKTLSSEPHGLRVKGSAWVAGFPIRNFEIKQDQDFTNDSSSSDYIGLDIDIGFRLSQASRSGRLVISMDLADLLIRVDTLQDYFQFHLVGFNRFKGVFGEHPYPIIWASRKDDQPRQPPWQTHICALTEARENKAPLGLSDLRDLIENTRDSTPDLKLFPPYFNSEKMPEHHKEIWNKQTDIDQNETAIDVLRPKPKIKTQSESRGRRR